MGSGRSFRPRGPSRGGGKKLPPFGVARRTGSVTLSRELASLERFLAEQTSEIRADHAAELRAIEERNLAGTWTKSDVLRAKRLANFYLKGLSGRKR